MSQLVTKITATDLQMLKELASCATQVVGWYPHGPGDQAGTNEATVRGPFRRWLFVTGGEGYEQYVASHHDDAKYAAAAMNYLPKLVERIEELEALLAVEDMLREK